MNGLQYLLLARLTFEPQSGYDLTQWIARAAHHYWAADHSSIYPALAKLQRQGYVTFETQPSERGPKRKVYSITEIGRQVLLEWVNLPPVEPEIRDEQMVKVLCYDLVPASVAIAQLQATRKRYLEKLTWLNETIRLLDDEDSNLVYRSHVGIRLTIRRGILSTSAYINWCDEAIALLKKQF
jgi:DNA-binding PadR family transcriptional regulator